jgi:hypothetical protein
MLMVWDIHNQTVIVSMGMAWDTGAPLWPYQFPDSLLLALNAPAYFIATPCSRLFGLIGTTHYFTLFPAILFWWWLVGIYLDRRRTVTGVKKTWWLPSLLSVTAILLLALGVDSLIGAFRWWFMNSREMLSMIHLIIILRAIAPALWCLVLSFVAAVAAKNCFRFESNSMVSNS